MTMPESDAPAWVLHVDLDQFLAAVEVLRRPELVGQPVIVGGRGDPAERAVVSTASYEARAFGVRSGMPLRVAVRKVPDAVLLPVDAPAYHAASAQVMAVLRAQPGAIVEVLGWDEAFLGVRTMDPLAYAREVMAAVLVATGLHCSVGIGDNKIRAKTATGFGKPQGTFQLTATTWFDVMGARSVRELWGVGAQVSKRLNRLGINSVHELADADRKLLIAEFGPRMGSWYHDLGYGRGSAVVDDSPWVARGRSREHTYQQDLVTDADIEAALTELVHEVMEDIEAEGRDVVRLTLKVRYKPFFTKTFSRTLPAGGTSDRTIVQTEAQRLMAKRERDRPIRLLGLRAEMVPPSSSEDDAQRTPLRGRI